MFCSLFEMDNYNYYQQAGDLIDVIRASNSAAGNSLESSLGPSSDDRRPWPHLPAGDSSTGFGDPLLFSTGSGRDPFPHPYFASLNYASHGGAEGFAGAADRPCNVFSRISQIAPNSNAGDGVISANLPCESTTAVGNSPSWTRVLACGGGTIPRGGPSPICSMANSGVQISATRNPTNKRRKSQARKVVCIPAPAPANIRSSSGEVVPSDLWAWRKYGQKPIKGSPYPRGYYRCSSSKGCSARKQVERSRTDPNMLVITYTSEHNHPWPTQRNALAGSTRSHPSRTSSAALETSPKHECNIVVKEEKMDKDQKIEKAVATTAANDDQDEGDHRHEFVDYDLIFSEFANQINDDHHCCNHLANPMNNDLLQFSSHGFSTGNDHGGSKDPFLELYDWAENSNGSLFKEAKGG